METLKARLWGAIKSKTIGFNFAVLLLGVASTVIPETSIPWRWQAVALAVIGAVNLLLRYITTQDLADK